MVVEPDPCSGTGTNGTHAVGSVWTYGRTYPWCKSTTDPVQSFVAERVYVITVLDENGPR